MTNQNETRRDWDWEIRSETDWLRWDWGRLWTYRHLLLRLVRRDFLVHHQQTILGPAWIIFQPMITLLTYILVFEKAVGLSTDGLPPTLFYLSGIILWNLFAETFTSTSFTFIQNATLFGKVYFPRLIIPLSSVVGNLVRFAIQFVIFITMLGFIEPDRFLQQPLPIIASFLWSVLFVAMTGLAMGIFFSVLTAKYRDLVNVIHLIVRLLMFATPIIYPLSMISPSWQGMVTLNPLTTMVEVFRYGFLGRGTFEISDVVYSSVAIIVLMLAGSMLFNKYSSKLQDVL